MNKYRITNPYNNIVRDCKSRTTDVYKNKYTPCAFGAYEKWGFRYDIERVKTGKIKRSN